MTSSAMPINFDLLRLALLEASCPKVAPTPVAAQSPSSGASNEVTPERLRFKITAREIVAWVLLVISVATVGEAINGMVPYAALSSE